MGQTTYEEELAAKKELVEPISENTEFRFVAQFHI